MTVEAKSNKVSGKLLNLNMNGFMPASDKKTYVNLNIDSDYVRASSKEVDTCCPAHHFGHNLTEWIDQVDDGMERVPCDMDPKEFYTRFMEPRIPVMLTGCTKDWPADSTWSVEKLMLRYADNFTWKCDVSLKEGSPVTLEMLRKCKQLCRESSILCEITIFILPP